MATDSEKDMERTASVKSKEEEVKVEMLSPPPSVASDQTHRTLKVCTMCPARRAPVLIITYYFSRLVIFSSLVLEVWLSSTQVGCMLIHTGTIGTALFVQIGASLTKGGPGAFRDRREGCPSHPFNSKSFHRIYNMVYLRYGR